MWLFTGSLDFSIAQKFLTLLCYWGGVICDGPDGVSYNKSPNKAINVHYGIKFDELINKIHSATSINKQQHHIKIICRFPSVGIGKVIKYIPLPIKDNDDIKIMFSVIKLHQEVSTLDMYLEVGDNLSIRQTVMASRYKHLWYTLFSSFFLLWLCWIFFVKHYLKHSRISFARKRKEWRVIISYI